MSRRLEVAVVGVGAIAQTVHLPLLARLGELFSIAALVDLSATRTDVLGERYGVPAARRYPTLEALLAARERGEVAVDGALVATTGSHGRAALALLEAGVPVLCEKPLAYSLAEIDALAAHAERTGQDLDAMLMVGYMKEYDPATRQAAAELEGARVRAVSVEVLHPADGAQLAFGRLQPPVTDVDPTAVRALQDETARVVDAAVGTELDADLRTLYANVVLGSVIHDVSLLRVLAGGVGAVETAVHFGHEMPGSVAVDGTTAGGARLRIDWHFIPDYPDYHESVTFHHEEGSVRLEFAVPYLLNVATQLTTTARTSAPDGAMGEVRSVRRWPQHEAFENEWLAFHAMVTTGARPVSGAAQARDDVVTGQRILAALARRQGARAGGEAGR